jgi:hypothetical protein
MIVFVTTPAHAYTARNLRDLASGVEVRTMSHKEILESPALPPATYVFTDIDRLPLRQMRAMAVRWRQLRDLGMRVLNDPARLMSRYGLLRRLHLAGFNRFNAYRVDEERLPERWPVFLRCEGDHRGPISELLHGPAALQAEIARVVDQGVPIAALLIIEYAAEETRPGLFRKYGCFRVGEARFAYSCVDTAGWVAKFGTPDVTPPPELAEEEYRVVRDNPWGPALEPAFDAAGIDYGRADFGLVGGRPQLYEINTNPDVLFTRDYPQPHRLRSFALLRENFAAALRSIDTPGGEP